MTEKVAVAFLLIIAATCFAIPVVEDDKNFHTVNVKDLGTVSPLIESTETCLIPCDNCQDDPICATDGKTYGCPNALTCYQMCGKKIYVASHGPCEEKGSAPPPEENDPLAPPKEE
ncbi:uncharacterized protein LOC117181811 [Belonocnema kinseyi]|uniref:uncharacterized protein LOC117181811 n=1 Tax=Belonocnema kinseyi TaxID=2817044 RepID=UPI00143D7734|nr:uncharacterized protein LOC117181811 [Belonocnema kinseyi]